MPHTRSLTRGSLPQRLGPWLALAAAVLGLLTQLLSAVRLVVELARTW